MTSPILDEDVMVQALQMPTVANMVESVMRLRTGAGMLIVDAYDRKADRDHFLAALGAAVSLLDAVAKHDAMITVKRFDSENGLLTRADIEVTLDSLHKMIAQSVEQCQNGGAAAAVPAGRGQGPLNVPIDQFLEQPIETGIVTATVSEPTELTPEGRAGGQGARQATGRFAGRTLAQLAREIAQDIGDAAGHPEQAQADPAQYEFLEKHNRFFGARLRPRSTTGRASSPPKCGSGSRRKPRSNSKCLSSPTAWARKPKNSETLLKHLRRLQELLVSTVLQQELSPLERDTQLISILVPIPVLSSAKT
jgi:hypothetical protein